MAAWCFSFGLIILRLFADYGSLEIAAGIGWIAKLDLRFVMLSLADSSQACHSLARPLQSSFTAGYHFCSCSCFCDQLTAILSSRGIFPSSYRHLWKQQLFPLAQLYSHYMVWMYSAVLVSTSAEFTHSDALLVAEMSFSFPSFLCLWHPERRKRSSAQWSRYLAPLLSSDLVGLYSSLWPELVY